MPPVRLSCFVEGKPKGKELAEDGATAVLNTPAGEAAAETKLNQGLFEVRTLRTKFPTEDGYTQQRRLINPDSLSRERRYRVDGKVVIVKATVIPERRYYLDTD